MPELEAISGWLATHKNQ